MTATTTHHVIQTDATREEQEQVVERLRAQYPDLKITFRHSDDASPCPSWCELEHDGGDWGTMDGRPVRSHQGPQFGPFLCGADQTLDGMEAPNVGVVRDVEGILEAAEFAELVNHATAANEWLKANA